METYEDIERAKWQTWANDCPIKSGLMNDMCFISGDKCQMTECVFWRFRALIRAEPTV